MEKEEQQKLLEQEEEVEEATLFIRKSRTENNGSKITEIVDFEVSDAVSEITTNGHTVHSELVENGDENEEETPAEEQEIEKLNGVLEKESESINGEKTPAKEQEIEIFNGVLEKEPESINGEKTRAKEQEIEIFNGVLEKEPESINGGKIPAKVQEIEKLNGVLEKEPESINGEKTPAKEQKIEKLNGVLEKEPEAINGEQKSQNLVFHDNVEGIWKCRLCTWTYRNGSVCVDHFQNHKGQLHHKLMNLKTFNFQSKGVDSTVTYLKEKQILKEPESKEFDISSLDFVVHSNSTSALNNGFEGEIKNSISSSIFKPIQVSAQVGPTTSAEIENAAVDQINEDDSEVAELDVERVIRDQTTHDLFCPNCNSCITKRVILRKRKRNIRISDDEFKRIKPEPARGPEIDQLEGDDAQITLGDEDEPDRGPAVFRCLSCFTFFIPTGNGFKCLPIKDWFASMFSPNKQGPVVEQGSITQTVVQRGDVFIPSSNIGDQPSFPQKPAHSPANVSQGRVEGNYTWEGGDETSPLLSQKPSVNGNVANGLEDKLDLSRTVTIGNTIGLFDSYTQDQKESNSSQVVHNNHGNNLPVTTLPTRTQVPNWKPVVDAIVFSQGGGKLPIFANNGSSTLEGSNQLQITNQTEYPEAKEKEVIHPHSPTSISASDVDGKFNISVSIPHEEHDFTTTITTDTVHQHNYSDFISSDSGHVHHSGGSEHKITTIVISNESPKFDNISVVTDGTVAPDTEITIHPSEESVPQVMNQTSVADNARKEYEIEVVKSIVYGGLAESITSLSVVSSAAGGGAATLNVLALGAANLIGGLFIICHNLWDLRYHQFEQVSNQINEQQDRYKELLGRRQSFILHAIVAIISYITFGLVPPLVYGFSYRKSDDRQLKLVMVGVTSLVCILILSIAKAYTRRPPKPYLKTVATYLVLGFMVSGVSYVAGELVERLLNELGLFQTSSVPNVEMKPTGSGWASY